MRNFQKHMPGPLTVFRNAGSCGQTRFGVEVSREIFQQTLDDFKFCFFIDGLNEHDGDCLDLAELVRPLGKDVGCIPPDHQETRRRINAHCRGFSKNINKSAHYDQKADLLHRTVRGFLCTKDIQEMLGSNVGKNFNTNSSLCGVFLAHVKLLRIKGWYPNPRRMQDFASICLLHARKVEETNATTPYHILGNSGLQRACIMMSGV